MEKATVVSASKLLKISIPKLSGLFDDLLINNNSEDLNDLFDLVFSSTNNSVYENEVEDEHTLLNIKLPIITIDKKEKEDIIKILTSEYNNDLFFESITDDIMI